MNQTAGQININTCRVSLLNKQNIAKIVHKFVAKLLKNTVYCLRAYLQYISRNHPSLKWIGQF